MSSLEEKFNESVEEWSKHCYSVSHHSIGEKYLFSDSERKIELEPVKEIIELGLDAIPLIYNHLVEDNKDHILIFNWYYIVGRITGKIIPVPEGMSGRVPELRLNLIRYLDEKYKLNI